MRGVDAPVVADVYEGGSEAGGTGSEAEFDPLREPAPWPLEGGFTLLDILRTTRSKTPPPEGWEPAAEFPDGSCS